MAGVRCCDEYYYYVKAVPKLSVAKPEKTVKRINGHRETEIMDTESVRNRRAARGDGRVEKDARLSGKRSHSESARHSSRTR